MHLSVVSSSGPQPSDFVPVQVDLTRQPWRPAEWCQIVDLSLASDLRHRVSEAAVTQGVPVGVVVIASVEAERAIAMVGSFTGKSVAYLDDLLDRAAAAAPQREIDPIPVRRLRAYARAIYAGLDAPSETAPSTLALRVPQSLCATWGLAAAEVMLPLEQWVLRMLEQSTLTRTRWEAAAAYAGRSLESWVVLNVLATR